MLARRGFSKTRKGQHREPRRNPSGTRRKAEHAGLLSRRRSPRKTRKRPQPPAQALALALRRVPRRAGRVQRIRPAQAAQPKPAPAHENAQGLARKTSLQSLQRSSRDGEGGPKPIKTREGPQGDTTCGPSRRVRRARPRHPANANGPARGRSPCGPSARAARATRKAPSASATPCPPAALRCSTLGEGGLNCRVRDGTG